MTPPIPPTPPAVVVRSGIPFWVVVVLIGGIVVLAGLWAQSCSLARSNGLRADSASAAADTTRFVAGVWERRSVQAELARDSLDNALKLKPAAQVVTVVTSKTVHDTVYAAVSADSGDSVRSANFTSRDAPFTTGAHVDLPRSPGIGHLFLTTTLDSIPLTIKLGCGDAIGGIHPASTVVSAPPWAKVGLSQVQSDPSVCNPPSAFRVGFSLPAWTVPAGFGLGFLLAVIVVHH